MHTVAGLMFVLAATLLALAPGDVEAKIYKCVGADGGVSYSQSPCATSEKTSKIMEEKTVREHFDCRVTRAFSNHVAAEMKTGLSADDLFKQYGGVNSITPTTLSVINYVFSHKGDAEASVERIAALSGARCDQGTYSRDLECEHFPSTFIQQRGGCAAIKGDSLTPAYNADRGSSGEGPGDEGLDDAYAAQVHAAQLRNESFADQAQNDKEDRRQQQNACRVKVREEISSIQERMRGRLSMDVHEQLSQERKQLRESYEAC